MNWMLAIIGFYVLVSGMGLVELGSTIPDIFVGLCVALVGLLLLCIPVFVRSEY